MLGSQAVARLPRPLHRAVSSVLVPAESAMRRLIVIAARGLKAKPAPSRPMPRGPIGRGGRHRLAFQLFDPRKRLAPLDRERGPSASTAHPHLRRRSARDSPLAGAGAKSRSAAPPDDGHIDARRLRLRLAALKLALDDLPRQARRLARLRAKREKLPSLKFKSPLRPGRPPGHRRIPVHQVDHLLAECHGLARDAMAPNTS